MPKTKPAESAEPVADTATEDRFYREELEKRGHTLETDPLLVGLKEFSLAANKLRSAWDETVDDGNHPIITAGAYPFGESFVEVSNAIATWYDATIERAKDAFAEGSAV